MVSGHVINYDRCMDGTFQPSAVALLDVLGFKGIERHGPPALIADALSTTRQTMKEIAGLIPTYHVPDDPGERIQSCTAWFSDTIYLAAQFPIGMPVDNHGARFLIDCVSTVVSAAIKEAATEPFQLVFRGVVTFGGALMEKDNILFGPAIVEASKLHENADGPFVWLTPKAAQLAGELESQAHLPSLTPYEVPMKNGECVSTLTVDPTYYASAEGAASVRVGFEAALARDSHGHDLTSKRQNATNFFEHLAKRATRR